LRAALAPPFSLASFLPGESQNPFTFFLLNDNLPDRK
jgi:hypothetical protein